MRLVFVSSTFKDMQFERDALKVRVAPRIDSFLAKYGENVHFGDLRWGVNTSELESEDSSKKVLKVCLDEIDNCRPYMIVFIGERYGWIPSSELLEETMKMKDIQNVPNDISVTNLEIEYGALLHPDFEGRVLFYFRNPIDTSEMDEEERKIYEAESPLHKEKLDRLKKVIEEKYPNYIRTYDVKYDKKSKTLVGLEPLMDKINEDLQRIFDLDLAKLNSLPAPERAVQNSHAFLERFYKNAYARKEAKLNEWNLDFDDYYYADEDNLPLVEMIYGPEGSGRRTLLALKYKLSLDRKDILTIPYVNELDEFTNDDDKFIGTIIYKIEERAGKEISHSTSIEYLAQLLDEIENSKNKFFINVFVMNADNSIIKCVRLLEAYKPIWSCLSFYLQSDDYDDEKDNVPQFKYNFENDIKPLEDDEKILLINAIAKSRHKEIAKPVINKIIQKEDSDNPLYLSLIVERLLMLDHEDFQNIRHLGDGMEAINKYMSQIVDQSGNDLVSISKDILKEIIERTNPEMALKLVAINTLKNHLNQYALEELFKYYGWPYNDLDYSLFKRLIPSVFAMSSDDSGITWFKNDQIVQAAKELIADYQEDNHLDDIINWLENVEVSGIITEKFIEHSKAVFYREKGDVNKFVDNLFRILTTQKVETLSDFSNDDFKNAYMMSSYYIKALKNSYRDEDGFSEKVDDEVIRRLTDEKYHNHILLLNLYHQYFINEKRTTKELIHFTNYQSKLSYKFILAHTNNPNNVALKDFAVFYALLSVSMDMESIEFMEDLETMQQCQVVMKFVQNNKDEMKELKESGKTRIRFYTNSIYESYKSIYDMAKTTDDIEIKKQIIMAIEMVIAQAYSDKTVGPLLKAVESKEELTITDKDKPNFCGLLLLLYTAANIYLELENEQKAQIKYEQGNYLLNVFLKSLTLDDLYDEKVFNSLPETIECLVDYVENSKETPDDGFANLVLLKLKLVHAIYPGNLKVAIMGAKFAALIDSDEHHGFESFRFFFMNALFGLLNMQKVKAKDVESLIDSAAQFRGYDIPANHIDVYMSYLLVDFFDKSDGDEEDMEKVFDMIYYYLNDWEKTKLKDPFFKDVVDGIAKLYKDPAKKEKELIKVAKQYIKDYL